MSAMRGPWKKLKAIGKGSFGEVFLVQKGAEEKKYVMKEVKLRGLPRAEMISAQNEVAVLKKLKHQHIVAIEEALIVDETLCIVMEWAQGKDLGELVSQRKKENRPFSETEVLKIFWQLTSALAYCHHDLHMLHRDLKPQNVFLAANGDVKLGDFGLAKIIEATCALAKTQCGTPVYMSPELCLGQDYNRAADVYALGCVLYELMTLTMPWADVQVHAAGGISALLKRIATSSLDLTLCKKRYSPELCGLLSALLHKRGASRPALDQVLKIDIVQRAAPKPPLTDERPLPPSWRKVPSASRPGQFSYLHLPTGYKQSFFPERDDLSEDIIAALAKQTFAPSRAEPPTAVKPPQMPTDMRGGGHHTPSSAPRAIPGGALGQVGPSVAPLRQNTPPSAAVRQNWTPPVGGIEPPLPAQWRKVPSASRPGQFSYLHLPTGYKQGMLPTSEAPPSEMLAAWKRAQAQGTAARGPATAMPGGAPPMGVGRPPQQYANKLDPVAEHRDPRAHPGPLQPTKFQYLNQQQQVAQQHQAQRRRW